MTRGDCKDCEQIMRERDDAIEWADRLADGIASVFGENIGDHSNMNHPWDNAMSILESACLKSGAPHASDCATNNGPAFPPGECDCK